MTRLAWVDCSAGAAGDMLLGALVGAGVAPELMHRAVAALGVPVTLDFGTTNSGSVRATRAVVHSAEVDPPVRTWADVRALLDRAGLQAPVAQLAHEIFRRVAEAEAKVHGSTPDDVHFHEVGAHDSIADVVGCAAGFVALGASVTVSPIALGGGETTGAHGTLTVPGPAVLEILRAAGLPAFGGPLDVELCTPTGAAVLAAVAIASGPMAAMTITSVGIGAGTRELPGRANVLRLVVGEHLDTPSVDATDALVLSANVDDLDPRLWPAVLDRLMEIGAADAWLVPILMKKGRPAHTLHVLCDPVHAQALRQAVFTETSTIGLREAPVAKRMLARRTVVVSVAGCDIRVKLAVLDGRVVNAQPEYEDVAAAARATGRPAKAVLAAAVAAADAER